MPQYKNDVVRGQREAMKMVKGLIKPCELSETQIVLQRVKFSPSIFPLIIPPVVESVRVAGGRSREGTTALCWPNMET